MRNRTRIGVFGWGVVAPRCPNVEMFRQNLASGESWLAPFNGFGPDNFLVGTPEFRLEDYQGWIEERFKPRRYQQLKEKMDGPSLYAIGAFIQSLAQNAGIESELQRLGTQCHVYIGTGLGNVATMYNESVRLHEAQLRWNEFWSSRPDDLRAYLEELAQNESLAVEGDVDTGKLRVLREKDRLNTKLQQKWGAPEPPWKVSANVIWNIHNTPAAQVSMLGHITGMTFAPVAACSSFGVALRLAMRAIQAGDARAVVVGATDPAPHPLIVGSFYSARVLSANGAVSAPLTRLQGTHVAGGAAVWIVADHDYMRALGFRPLGMEPLAVGVTSDAHHIITPTEEGPKAAIAQALGEAGISAEEIGTWDLHATATPGDYSEMTMLSSVLPKSVLATARKGTFGHGMSVGGAWELTAQYLGYEAGRLFPTPFASTELHPAIAALHDGFVFNVGCNMPQGAAGKLSMGIGGINACVVSRPW